MKLAPAPRFINKISGAAPPSRAIITVAAGRDASGGRVRALHMDGMIAQSHPPRARPQNCEFCAAPR
jgi:hypothetical protein